MRFSCLILTILLASSPRVQAACCYFSAKNADILQPAQKVFITWDPGEKIETFTVQWSRGSVGVRGDAGVVAAMSI